MLGPQRLGFQTRNRSQDQSKLFPREPNGIDSFTFCFSGRCITSMLFRRPGDSRIQGLNKVSFRADLLGRRLPAREGSGHR